ncbi:hypothetical protein CBR_g29897 [Chara braunii]|uniref:Uncharacterized protein n=1 Tax=Chara braunii TaxID=69332 RepID=A0A388JWX2_CHABU|nr:hypothetical protein CBR_g29897 [Chara braunii]|eukprot:GBG62289.1 hypothetical protein CBR_g29897 [Chara braunii]
MEAEVIAVEPGAGGEPQPHGGDVGMVGEDEVIPQGATTPQIEREEEGKEQNRSPPPAHTNYWAPQWAEEERVRDMLPKCYDDVGIVPSGWDIGELREDGTKAHFILNPSLDEIKIKWLKERTVTVIFQEGSKNLPKKLKEEVIRVFEDIWLGEKRFDEAITRGRVYRVTHEGRGKTSVQGEVMGGGGHFGGDRRSREQGSCTEGESLGVGTSGTKEQKGETRLRAELKPTKLRRRVSEDMHELRIQEEAEGESSSNSEVVEREIIGMDGAGSTSPPTAMKRRRQLIASRTKDITWKKYLMPLLFIAVQEEIFELA